MHSASNFISAPIMTEIETNLQYKQQVRLFEDHEYQMKYNR